MKFEELHLALINSLVEIGKVVLLYKDGAGDPESIQERNKEIANIDHATEEIIQAAAAAEDIKGPERDKQTAIIERYRGRRNALMKNIQ